MTKTEYWILVPTLGCLGGGVTGVIRTGWNWVSVLFLILAAIGCVFLSRQ
jgi:hypothetical protein